jgi:putative SOS response-associated peptidase YedK
VPYYIQHEDGRPMLIAGLRDVWHPKYESTSKKGGNSSASSQVSPEMSQVEPLFSHALGKCVAFHVSA